MNVMDDERVWTNADQIYQEAADRQSSRSFGPRELAGILRRHLVLIAAIAVLGTALSVVAASILPKTYTARSMIVLDRDDPNLLADTPETPSQQPDKAKMDTEADLIASRAVAGGVVDELNLISQPDFNTYLSNPDSGGVVSTILGAVKGMLLSGAGAEQARSLPPTEVQRDRAISTYLSRLSVTRSGESLAMTVAVFDDEPKMAANLANATTNLFVEWSRKRKRDDTKDAAVFLRQQANDLAARISKIEDQIAEYGKANGVSSDPRDDLLRAAIEQNNQQLSTAKGDLVLAQARLEQVKQVAAGKIVASQDPLVSSEFLTSLRNDEATALRDRALLARNYGAKHPLIQDADAKIASVRGLISQEMQRIVANLENDARVAEGRVSQLLGDLNSSSQELRQRSLAEIELRELNRDLLAEQKLYDVVVARLGRLDPYSDVIEPSVRVVSTAEVPTSPSFPRTRVLVGGGFVGSLVVGFLVALTLEGLDTRVRDPARGSQLLRAPLLGSIPKSPRKLTHPLDLRDELLRHPRTAFAEAFRSIHNALGRMGAGERPKVTLVTSALPRDGKTTVAVGVALMAATNGMRTALVDLDLRTGNLHAWLQVGPAPRTLNAFLSGACDLPAIMQPAPDLPLLDVLATSDPEGNALEVLNACQLQKLLDALRLAYDVVIVDAPPILVVDDAGVIASASDAAILVAAWEDTRQEALLQAGERLRLGGAPLAGWVLNRVDASVQAQGLLQGSRIGRKDLRRYFRA